MAALEAASTRSFPITSRQRRRSSSSRSSSPPLTSLKSADNMEKLKSSGSKPTKRPGSPSENINIFGKTGGAYIPPARLRQMQAKITDKSSDAYQRIAWEALKKSIHGLINKVNVSNIAQVVRQLLCENIVRGRGLLVKSLITSQTTSPTFTHVFAALIAVVNTKFPQVGELLLKRLINEFRKAFRRNQKDRCLTTARFLAHLVNQKVAHELIVLELLTLLLEQTTDDSVEVSVATLKECGAFLSQVVPKGLAGIFDHLRRILNESQCDKRIAYMIEIRRDGWKDHPTMLPELDLIDEDDQITHTLSLLDPVDPEEGLNIYHFDPDFESNEEKYSAIRASFLGDGENESSGSDSGSGSESDDEEEGEEGVQGPGEQESGIIIDQTETNLVHLRRTIYLMLQSSVSADEGAHRLLQLKIKPGEEYEVASMVLDCCAQTRSYETRYGSLAQRLCRVMLFSGDRPKPGEEKPKSDPSEPPRTYVAQFEKIFSEQYATVHRLETTKLKNVAMFFAHLLFTDSISWGVFECVKLNERDTTSSGRIFLKYLFQELCSFMGLAKLQARLRDETLQPFFAGLLPRDNPKDTRFAINFLTTIGLGGLTIDLREHLQASKGTSDKAKLAEAVAQLESSSSSSSSSESTSSSSDSSSSESSSSDSSTSSTSSSSSDSDDSEEEEPQRKGGIAKEPVKKRREPSDRARRSPQSPEIPENTKKNAGRREEVERTRSRGQANRSPPPRHLSPPDESRIPRESPNSFEARQSSYYNPSRSKRQRHNISSPDSASLKERDEALTAQYRHPSPDAEKRRRYDSPMMESRGRCASPLSKRQTNELASVARQASRSPKVHRQPSPAAKRSRRYKSPLTDRYNSPPKKPSRDVTPEIRRELRSPPKRRQPSPLVEKRSIENSPTDERGCTSVSRRRDGDFVPQKRSRHHQPSPNIDQRHTRGSPREDRGGRYVSPLSRRQSGKEERSHRRRGSSHSPLSKPGDRRNSPAQKNSRGRRDSTPQKERTTKGGTVSSRQRGGRCGSPPSRSRPDENPAPGRKWEGERSPNYRRNRSPPQLGGEKMLRNSSPPPRDRSPFRRNAMESPNGRI
ncbi:unnamed protein product [Mesocestoides corti]|uniref:MI domain-containing protein n=1 Tax=Mesocestoides corti TaxID=53468 RepID=A0A0R3UK42_MESCO|nr:unnamed protein product [Mesocestoides corti]